MTCTEAGRRSPPYQFRFDNQRLSERGKPCTDPDHPLAPIVDVLNSTGFRTAMRQLTGRPDIAVGDAQAPRLSITGWLRGR